jgi:hypothetical protein
MPWFRFLPLVASLLALAGPDLARAAPPPQPADPLTIRIHQEDAEGFAQLFAATKGRPSAEQLQTAYLDVGSYGVRVFTPDRIENAQNLARTIADHPAQYEHAINACLPQITAANADLRAIYLAFHGLLPEQPLPQIYIVFGAGNSGGTAGPGAQVLGLEVLCEQGDSPAALRTTLRRFFAHETVHTFQHEPALAAKSPLLADVLTEGAADFIAELVTGETPEPARAQWAAPQEKALWAQFQQDMVTAKGLSNTHPPQAAQAALHRWVENYQHAPQGWPFELGYWLGARIWRAYYEASPDKHQAIRDMLDWDDPEVILKASRYAPR